DVVMPHAARLIHRQLDHLLGAWRQADLACYDPVAMPDDMQHGGARIFEIHIQPFERNSGDALTLSYKPEQQLLGSHIVVAEALRLILGERHHDTRPVGELLECVLHRAIPLNRRPRWSPKPLERT